MSLHYLLDGYNVLKQIPAFRDLPLEEGRRGLLRWIDITRPQGSVNNQVTVVFDGHPDYFSASPHGEIRVIFSDGCSADDTIKLMVEEDAYKKSCVVVSDDKDIFLYARSLGAKVMSVAAFTSKTETFSARQDAGGKYISLSSQEKINKELRSFWLKEEQ
ncbi:MAG: NYN domain-containing protein [Candidatus Omnitrophica bacterium]|nr:NYN domain-containing protein [Candidatus Omnitrophota bacterium]